MSNCYYYVDTRGNHCSVEPACVTQHHDGCWYDRDGHQCHPKLDGIVEGSSNGDLIDYAYTGDPDGDKIDHNDQILSGAQRNDDLVYAYGGNDTVLAGEGNDKVYGGDGHDSLSGGNGNDTQYGDAGNDTLAGGAGCNLSDGGAGDDRFIGGAGADTFEGGTGQDNLDYSASAAAVTINLTTRSLAGGDAANDGIAGGIDGVYGSAFNDNLTGFDHQGTSASDTFTNQFYGNGGDDCINGMGGNDKLFGGADRDLIYGGTGDDLVSGDAGNDTLHGDDGHDSVTGGDGRDLAYGGAGNDVIDTSSGDLNQRPDIGYPGLYPADSDVTNDRDTVYGGAGDDTIRTGDDADSIRGDDGHDSIDAGVDDDTVFGDAGNDTIIGAEGSDIIDGGAGQDLIYGGYGPGTPDAVNIPDATDLAPANGLDSIHGGDGNDTIFGMDDRDTLYGDAGNDQLDGGIDDDRLYGGDNADIAVGGQGNDTLHGDAGNDTASGGTGNDVLYGGEGADSLSGGDDRDLFVSGTGGDVVDGNEGGNDFDTLDLTGAGPLNIVYDPLNPENGTVQFLDPTDHHVTGTMTFRNIENVIPCFTPGTLIATPRGEVAVEALRIGDRIITRDSGMQEVRWIGRRDLSYSDLAAAPHLKPVLIRQGALGHGLPEQDMMVSPNHRLLVTNDRTALYFDEHEVLVAAKHLVTSKGVSSVDAAGVSYIHFMCDRHEVVLSNGGWSETFQPGDMTLKGMGNAQRSEIFDLFPALKTPVGLESYAAARKTLKRHEAALLAR